MPQLSLMQRTPIPNSTSEEEATFNVAELTIELWRELHKTVHSPTRISQLRKEIGKRLHSPTPIPQLIPIQQNPFPNSSPANSPELPRELWREIGKRLHSRLDLSRFRSVCRTWRSSLPPPIRFPLQIPAPPGPSEKPAGASYFISEVTFYSALAADDRPMIVAFEEEYKGGKFTASAFLHKTQVHHTKLLLPLVSKLSPTLKFLSNAYHVHNALPRSNKKCDAGKYNFRCNLDVLKIAIISSDASAPNPSYSRLCDLKVVAHLRDGTLAVLALARGAMNNVWHTTSSSKATYQDIVNHNGQLYAVDKSGAAFVMDYDSLQMTRVAPALPKFTVLDPRCQCHRRVLHLVVAQHCLYMFCHEHRTVPRPNLYKLSSRLGLWIDACHELPNHVFVKDARCNFAVPRDLIRRYTHGNCLLKAPRFCSWPDFVFVRIAVGLKNTYDPPCRPRHCDRLQLPYVCRQLLED